MREIERIRGQIHRAFEGEAWHGPSLREALEGVTAQQAAARSIPNAHSIWELVLHLAAWEDVVRRRMGGEQVVEPPEGDWPAVRDTDEAAWQAAREHLQARHRALLETVSSLDEATLDEKPYEGTVSRYVGLHGIAEHTAYHAGQIALLKKAVL